MHEAGDARAEGEREAGEALLGGGHLGHLALADQRADPVGLAAGGDGAAEVLDDLGGAPGGDERGLDRLAAGRLLVEDREVHVAVLGERQAARDRGRGHHQDVGALALLAEVHALADAEAVLLVDDGEAEVAEGDVLLEEGVGADEDGDLAGGQRREPGGALGALVAAGEDLEADAGGLARAGARERRCWRARISVGAIIAAWPPASTAASMARKATSVLPAPTSPWSRRFMRLVEAMSAVISATERVWARGRRVGERGEDAGLQAAVAAGREALGALHPRPGDGQRHLVGEELVVGEALAGRGGGARSAGPVGRVGGGERGAEGGPAALAQDARLDPFGQVGDAGERVLHGAGHGAERQALGERIDRLEGGQRPRRRRGGGCGRGGASGRCRRRARPGRRRCGAGRRGACWRSQSDWGWKKTSWNSVSASRTWTR